MCAGLSSEPRTSYEHLVRQHVQSGEEDGESMEAAVRVSNYLTALTLLECFHKLSGRSLEPLTPLRLQEANALRSHCVLLMLCTPSQCVNWDYSTDGTQVNSPVNRRVQQ